MTLELTPSVRSALEAIVEHLEAAWNAGDGPAFAAPFATDADFVNVRGEHFRGRATIADGHAEIFRTIYVDSANRYRLESARLLAPDLALAHVHASLEVPAGPLKGHHAARFSLVLTHAAGGWEIASFHNTLVAH